MGSKKLWKITLLGLTLMLGVGCVVGDQGRGGRPFVKDLSGSTTTEFTGCGSQLYNTVSGSCVSSCPSETHSGTNAEIQSYLSDKSISLITIFNNSSGACFSDEVTSVRPDDQVYVKNDFCICKDKKKDMLGNCEAYCAQTSTQTGESVLFGSVTLGADVALNSELGNLYNWCTKELTADNGLFTSPQCTLRVTDNSNNSQDLNISISNGSNSFSVVMPSSVQYDKTYIAKIVEIGTGSEVSSSEFQIRRKLLDTSSSPTGPLKIMPISQYTCLTRQGTVSGTTYTFNSAVRLHYYFPLNDSPQSMPPNSPFLICHDTNLYGDNDSPLYPRLEHIPQHFALWDVSDIRFADQNQDSNPDINDTIANRLILEYDLTQSEVSSNIFGQLNWPTRPGLGETPPLIGIYMQPWIDTSSGKSYCPTQTHYNSSIPVFQLLKEYVGVSTEGIFLAQREPLSVLDQNTNEYIEAPDDILIIRENLLKQIWFYFENNQHKVPSDSTVNSKTIHFYWPADTTDPLTRKSTQKIYTIRAPSNIGINSSERTTLPTTISPPDKRFGCVPALD